MKQNKFGKAPFGDRLERVKTSSNFKQGKFQNISITPALAEGYSMPGIIYSQLFKKVARRFPAEAIPSIKTNLLELPIGQDVLVWFGHSSYFIQIEGKRILVDPVFSGNASPIRGTVKAFKGSDIYTVDDLPGIDYLFISHDHYDHLDYETIIKLKSKVNTVVCGLGVGSHFEHWSYEPSRIIEKDWHESVVLDNGITVFVTPARHFSGRGFSRNNTLWCSYVLQTPAMKIYIGGDSGYDSHFAEIGNKFGPIDLAILDNGQYNAAWRYIHMLPDEVMRAAQDLKAKRLFPVHSSKFALANHSWDEPLSKVTELNKGINIPLVTPRIGEVVELKNPDQPFKQWWVGVK
jgi:L-ascorbate metabolism protein UlaG (beta-lactamase superfamily)